MKVRSESINRVDDLVDLVVNVRLIVNFVHGDGELLFEGVEEVLDGPIDWVAMRSVHFTL